MFSTLHTIRFQTHFHLIWFLHIFHDQRKKRVFSLAFPTCPLSHYSPVDPSLCHTSAHASRKTNQPNSPPDLVETAPNRWVVKAPSTRACSLLSFTLELNLTASKTFKLTQTLSLVFTRMWVEFALPKLTELEYTQLAPARSAISRNLQSA